MNKLEKQAKQNWAQDYSQWGVSNYGISLFINRQPLRFPDGIFLDVEHDGKGGFVSLGIFDGKACYYWSNWQLAKQLTIPRFIAHNGASDIECLNKWGFKIDASWLMWDTQLIAHILDSSRKSYGLKNLAKQDLGIEYPSYDELTNEGVNTLDKLPLELVAEYNAMDTYTCFRLYEKQMLSMNHLSPTCEMEIYFEQIEKPVSFIFKEMENKGIRIDLNYLSELKDYLEDRKAPIEQEIKNELGNINLNSPKQLLKALHAKEIYPKWKGKASTDKRGLECFRTVPIVQRLSDYSEYDTLLSNFVYPYLERKQKAVHSYFNQCGTRTGRPSCSNPNLLQIPKKTENGKCVRRMFIPCEGQLFGNCDFGQIEPRLMAHLSKDEILCGMFNDGKDFHDFTANRLSINRERAKILNLSVGYRATFKSVSQQLKCTNQEAQVEIDKWWNMFPQMFQWQEKLIWQSKKDGYCTTLMGRRIKVDGLNDWNKWKREAAQRQLLNNIVQGSAAEIMKMAMIEVDKLNMVDILIQIYDELLFEFDEKDGGILERIQDKMENCYKLDVPLVVSSKIGSTWADCK